MTTPAVPASETDAERIARRYPPPRAPRWLWIPIAAVLGGVGSVWLIWSGVHGANPPVSGKVVAFEVVSDTETKVRFTVQRPKPEVPATCTVIVQAITYDTVGELPVAIPPGTEELTKFEVTVRTFKRATSASLQGCTTP